MSKKLKQPIKNDKKDDEQNSVLSQLVGTVIGNIPIMIMLGCCLFILNKEYISRQSNFWAKSYFYGMIDPHDYFEKVKCADKDYKIDRANFKSCAPKFCGRYFSDFVFNEQEANTLLDIAKKGFQYGESSGGASIFDIHNGVVSKGKSFISVKNLLKEQNKELLSKDDVKEFNKIKDKIIDTIKAKFGIADVYLTKPVFFSKITSKQAETLHDEYWHSHIDKDQYEGFHYTTLVYLNNHQKDYMGGRFFWTNEKDNTTLSHEPRKGRLSIFSSGSENRHHVEKVLSGTRYAVTIPFTCNKKLAINIE